MSNFLIHSFVLRSLFVQFRLLPRRALISCVKLYQKTLSPDHGALRGMYPYGFCRHSPTCSQYAIEQLETRGAMIGTLKAAWRILHCNPFAKPSDAKMHELAEQMTRDR